MTSSESYSIVELEIIALKILNLGRVIVNVFFGDSVVILSIDFDNEFILWWGQVVCPYLLQRRKASNGNRLRKEWVLRAPSQPGCHNLLSNLQF